jgi:hypothetical protein
MRPLMQSGEQADDDKMGTGYAPPPAPANAGVCSWCGQRQSERLLVVMNADGSAGICELCAATHGRFFSRRRTERNRPAED